MLNPEYCLTIPHQTHANTRRSNTPIIDNALNIPHINDSILGEVRNPSPY